MEDLRSDKMEDWQETLLWVFIVLEILAIVMALYNVSRGTYEEKRTPVENAFKAVMAVLFALFYLTLIY